MFDEKFLEDNLEKVLGLHKIPQNKKKEIIKAMQKHIQSSLASKVMGSLSMKDKMKLGVLSVKKDPEEIMKFMTEKVPNLPSIIQEEVASFRPKAIQIINS